MPYTLGQVPPDCDPSIQSESGVAFMPFIFTLRVTGSDATLVNAAGGNIGGLVATGTVTGNSLSLTDNRPRPATGLKFGHINVVFAGPSATAGSGSGTFEGSQAGCLVPFTLVFNLDKAWGVLTGN